MHIPARRGHGGNVASIPHDGSLESGPALLREGYLFVSNRCRRLGSDAFETRLGGRTTVCMLGEDAARTFYERPHSRAGALPKPIQTLLQDEGSVQVLDGAPHRRRKELFLEVAGPDDSRALAIAFVDRWDELVERRRGRGAFALLPAVEELLCRAVCAWVGVPLGEAEASERTSELAAMIDGAGSLGPRNWRGHLLRRRTERWAADLVLGVRAQTAEPSSRLERIALHRDTDGTLLPADVAAVEVINVLRPVVAVARYVAFVALALHVHPGAREAVAGGGEADAEALVQEVRRYYPFFPAVAGIVTEPYEWRGRRFEPGLRVLLDLYGTNHDARIWDEPESFRADRFAGRRIDPFTLIPQGGGDHLDHHRCPGEWATIELAKAAARRLAEADYALPPQDLSVRLSRMPAAPESGFVLELR